MKTLKLKVLNIGVEELLSREQMRRVLGGSGSSGGCNCATSTDCDPGERCVKCGSSSSGGRCEVG